MKKFLMAVFALAVATSVATAGVAIQWSVANWGEFHDGMGGAILDNNSVLWQLIYAGPNNVIDAIDDPMNPVDPVAWAANDYLAGDDVLWGQRTIAQGGGIAPEDGTDWDEWLSYQGGFLSYQDTLWSTDGFVYQRVFESASPLGSTWFYQTDLLALNTGWETGGPAQEFYVDSVTEPFTPDRQVSAIPEPATMSLLGLGALAMVLRRRRS